MSSSWCLTSGIPCPPFPYVELPTIIELDEAMKVKLQSLLRDVDYAMPPCMVSCSPFDTQGSPHCWWCPAVVEVKMKDGEGNACVRPCQRAVGHMGNLIYTTSCCGLLDQERLRLKNNIYCVSKRCIFARSPLVTRDIQDFVVANLMLDRHSERAGRECPRLSYSIDRPRC